MIATIPTTADRISCVPTATFKTAGETTMLTMLLHTITIISILQMPYVVIEAQIMQPSLALTRTSTLLVLATSMGWHETATAKVVHNNNDTVQQKVKGVAVLIANDIGDYNDYNNNNSSSNSNKNNKKRGSNFTQNLLPNATHPHATGTNISSVNRHNNNNNSTHLFDMDMTFYEYCLLHRNSFADLFTIILYSIVCIVGLFGNTLVIYVVLRFSKMQTVTNIYILNLAIADECFLIGIPFLLYTMRICSWKFGDYICKAYMVSTSITQFTSSIFLLIMSADRYIAVCHPIASPKYRTTHIAKLVSALAWLTSAILMVPVILYASTVIQEDGENYSCNIEWPETYKRHSGTTFILYTFFLGFATPLCFILTFYYLVIRKLHTVGNKHKSKEKKRSHRKVTRLVLTVITVYICCWLPHWISQVALINSNPAQDDLSRLQILIFLLLGCLVYSNSAMNPILYAFLSDNFRKSFYKAFTCMANHEVNAQLHAEPSLYTKHGTRITGKRGATGAIGAADDADDAAGASGGGGGGGYSGFGDTKRSAKRKFNKSKTKINNNAIALGITANNSSTTTSSTTTAEKSNNTSNTSNSSQPQPQQHQTTHQPNGGDSRNSTATNFEADHMINEQEHTVCAVIITEPSTGQTAPEATILWAADTDATDCMLQTDL